MELSLLPVVSHLLVDAGQVGLTAGLVHVNKLHHKDATTYQPPVAEADFIGTLLHVHVAQAAAHQLQQVLPAAHQLLLLLAHVHPDITG